MDAGPLSHTPYDDAPSRGDGSWMRTAGGVLLVLVGVELLLERLLDREFSLLLPALGLVLLAVWFRHDRFPFLVAGSLSFGLGLGLLVQSLFGNAFAFADAAGLAWGFWFIQQVSGRRIAWARVGFLITLTAALFELATTVGIGRALGATFGGAAAPLAVVTVGVLLVFRRRLTPQVFVVGVVVAATLGLSAVGGGLARALDGLGDGFGRRSTVVLDVPPLDGRTLVLEGGSGDVTVETGRSLSVRASIRSNHDRPPVNLSDEEIVVGARRGNWREGGSVRYLVVLPAGADLRIGLGSGDVSGAVDGGVVDITTGSGDVDLAVAGDPDVDITTGSGEVELTVAGDPDVDVTTGSGDIEAEGFEEDDVDTDEKWFYDGEGDGLLSIDTGSGDVELTKVRR